MLDVIQTGTRKWKGHHEKKKKKRTQKEMKREIEKKEWIIKSNFEHKYNNGNIHSVSALNTWQRFNRTNFHGKFYIIRR